MPVVLEETQHSLVNDKINRLSNSNLIMPQSLPTSMLNLALNGQNDLSVKQEFNNSKINNSGEFRNRVNSKAIKMVAMINGRFLRSNNQNLNMKNNSDVNLVKNNSDVDLNNSNNNGSNGI